MRSLCDDVYKQFSDFLEVQCGIVLGANKQYLVKSRLVPLMDQFSSESLSDLIHESMSYRNRDLRAAVIDAMTTNETLWFRDKYPFELLTKKIFPEMSEKKKNIKMWSAASSSGQEAYSIAMTALDFKKRYSANFSVQITGTDISTSMLNQCKEGTYDTLALSRGLTSEHKNLYFNKLSDSTGKMQLKPEVKRLANFKSYNLLDSYGALGKFDIIFCRNVLIYFSSDVKSKILNQFAGALNPKGYLVLGASESMTGLCDKFEMIRCNPGIIYQLK